MSRLLGQAVTVVGASSGIGLATAKRAALEQARVSMLSRSQSKLQTAAAELPPSVRTRALDMLDRTAVAAAATWLGEIDHLVLTAVADETASCAPVAELTAEQLERSFDKLRGYTNVISAVAKQISVSGSITMLSPH